MGTFLLCCEQGRYGTCLPTSSNCYIFNTLGVMLRGFRGETKLSFCVNLRCALYRMIIMEMREDFKYDEQLGKLL